MQNARPPLARVALGLATALSAGVLVAEEPLAQAAIAEPRAFLQRKKDKKEKKKRAIPDRIVPFGEDLKAAKASALERNVPVLILMMLEDEEASDRFRDDYLDDKEIAKATANVIVVLSNNGVHELVTVNEEIDGREVPKEVCEVYGTPSCTVHQKTWDQAYLEFNEDGELTAPHVLLLGPDGKLKKRIATRDVPPVRQVANSVKDAQEECGPGLYVDELRQVKALAIPARRHTDTKDWPAAWRAWQAILDVSEHGAWGDEARSGLAAAQAGVDAEVQAATALLVPGTAADGYRRLAAMLEEMRGMPLEKDLERRLKGAERDKAIKSEIQAYKAEIAAEEVWQEALAAFDEGKAKKAERLVRKLLRSKKLAGTDAARKAREAHPEWAAEEAG